MGSIENRRIPTSRRTFLKGFAAATAASTGTLLIPDLSYAQIGGLGGGEVNPSQGTNQETNTYFDPSKVTPESIAERANKFSPVHFISEYAGKETDKEAEADYNFRSLLASVQGYGIWEDLAKKMSAAVAFPGNPNNNIGLNYHLTERLGSDGQIGLVRVGVMSPVESAYPQLDIRTNPRNPVTLLSTVHDYMDGKADQVKPLVTHTLVLGAHGLTPNVRDAGTLADSVIKAAYRVQVFNQEVAEKIGQGMSIEQIVSEIKNPSSELNTTIKVNSWKRTLQDIVAVTGMDSSLQVKGAFADFLNQYQSLIAATSPDSPEVTQFIADYNF